LGVYPSTTPPILYPCLARLFPYPAPQWANYRGQADIGSFKNFEFMVDMASFNIQTINKIIIFQFSKKICPKILKFKIWIWFFFSNFATWVIFIKVCETLTAYNSVIGQNVLICYGIHEISELYCRAGNCYANSSFGDIATFNFREIHIKMTIAKKAQKG
jgi:hypothetical protein